MRYIKKVSKSAIAATLAALFLFTSFVDVRAEDRKVGYGLKPLTADQLYHLEHKAPKVVGVRPNKVGAARIHQHLKEIDHPPIHIAVSTSHQDELMTHEGSLEGYETPPASTPLPSAVNNSTLPSFPPIGDQAQLGSCVAWSSTYYQVSHEVGLANGVNNKTSFTGVYSPKWTYNLLNGGQDGGLNPTDAYQLLSQNGATSIVNFPYDTNYRAWDLQSQDWISALSARMAPYQLVSGVNTSPQNLTAIKQLLVNGHILSFCTYIDSWVFTHVGNDPSNPNSPYVGQLACSWMNGYDGGHCTTIVGYNDNVWIDINGNGVVDAGEKGAFLVANSWGSDWGNHGFVWISYDAFLTNSAVHNGPSADRVPAGDALNSYFVSLTPKANNYSPKLIGEFTLSQSIRDQIAISLGLSDTTHTSPTTTFPSGTLINSGGNFEFNGTSPGAAESATFAADYSDLLATIGNSVGNSRYYLTINDDQAGHPTVLSAFSLNDLVHNHQVNYANVPVSCDNSGIKPYIDYDFNGNNPPDTTPPVVQITSPTNNSTITGSTFVTVSATDDVSVAKVDFYVDSTLYATDTTTPYTFSLDTTQLSNGSHTLKVIAYDTSNNQTQSTVTVTVTNSIVQAIIINAGGGQVINQGITWAADNGYTASSTYSNPIGFSNPIYQTERYGRFSYNFNISNGQHTVKLKFAEIYFKAANKRVFDVAINGTTVITNLDLYKAAGYGTPYDLSFPVNVTNGKIKIDFIPVVENPKVSGIQIN